MFLFGIRCELFYTFVKFPSVFLSLWGLCKCCIAAFNVSINYCYYNYDLVFIPVDFGRNPPFATALLTRLRRLHL